MEVGLFAFAALCMGTMGSTQLAAHQIALQIVSVAFMVPAGMSYAVTMRIGQHYGAGQLLQARMAGRVGISFWRDGDVGICRGVVAVFRSTDRPVPRP